MQEESGRQKKLDELLGRALRDKGFRDRLMADPAGVAKEAGLSEEEMNLVAGGLAIGSGASKAQLMWCTEKTCNETGGIRVVMFSPDKDVVPIIGLKEPSGKAGG